jgi:hypothetical protein
MQAVLGRAVPRTAPRATPLRAAADKSAERVDFMTISCGRICGRNLRAFYENTGREMNECESKATKALENSLQICSDFATLG